MTCLFKATLLNGSRLYGSVLNRSPLQHNDKKALRNKTRWSATHHLKCRDRATRFVVGFLV